MARRRALDAWLHRVALALGARRPGDAPPVLGADLQVASVRGQLGVRLVVRALFGAGLVACFAPLAIVAGPGPPGRVVALALIAGAAAAAATAFVQHAAVPHAGRPGWSPRRLAGAATAVSSVLLAAGGAQVGALLLTGELDLQAQVASLAALLDTRSTSVPVLAVALAVLIFALCAGGAVGGAALAGAPAVEGASTAVEGASTRWSVVRWILVMAGTSVVVALFAVALLRVTTVNDQDAVTLLILAQVVAVLTCVALVGPIVCEALAVGFVEARLRRRRRSADGSRVQRVASDWTSP